MSAFVAGLSASIFSFWGWDSALTVNEESKDSGKTPGRAALLAVVSILLTYLLVSVSTLMYAGDGTEGLGLGNEEISDNVFGALAEPVMGTPWNNLLFLAVLASSAAQPDDDVPADHPDDARDGDLRALPEAVRQHPPRVS